MSRLVLGTKKIVELYLIIVGGAYSLTALVALIVNKVSLGSAVDATEIHQLHGDIGNNWVMLISAGLIFTAGIGVKLYRWWGLLLAGVMGVVVVEYAITQSAIDPWEYHNFTLGLPMTAILVWVMLPPTWRVFKRRSLRAS